MSFVVEDPSIDKLLSDLEAKARHPEDIAHDDATRNHESLLSTMWFNRVQQASTVLRLFKRQLNDTSPVNCLPVEILGTIFRFVQTQKDDPFQLPRLAKKESHTSNPYMWIAITHVCQHWRKVALADAELWKCIRLDTGLPESSEQLANLFLERCALLQTGIALHLISSQDNDCGEFDAIFESLSKVDILAKITSIYLDASEYHDELFAFLVNSFPNVAEVQVSLQEYGGDYEDDEISAFIDECPSVRRLLLVNIGAFPPIPGLTHLFLDEACVEMSYKEFRLCLKAASTTLQVLYLKNSSPYVPTSQILSKRASAVVIPMPHLRHIEIYQKERVRDALGCYLLFLDKLCLPSNLSLIWDAWLSDCWTEGCAPPEEVLRNITSLVGCARREGPEAIVIEGTTLWIARFPISGVVMRSVPNLTSMVLPNADYAGFLQPHRIKDCLYLEDLHLRICDDFFDAIHMLEVEPDHMFPDVFSKLKTITAYTGDVGVESKTEWDIISARLTSLKPPLPELRLALSEDCTITRYRKHLGTTYTLHFKAGNVDQHLAWLR